MSVLADELKVLQAYISDGASAPDADRRLTGAWSTVKNAITQAERNRGKETQAFKAVHDYLKLVLDSSLTDTEKTKVFDLVVAQLCRIRGWAKPTWFRQAPSAWRDGSDARSAEYEFIRSRIGLSVEQMKLWDVWASDIAIDFLLEPCGGCEKIEALDKYLVRRVAIDSVKNWMRRCPDEKFINTLFAALAENKLYITDPAVRVRALKDSTGHVRMVEKHDGHLVFDGGQEDVTVQEDESGQFIMLPDDCDMVIFENRILNGIKQVVPVAQPNDRDPNIQWFRGVQVKRGLQKERLIAQGPQAFSPDELYGFFPDHFPMRLTSSASEKTGAAIFGYALDHSGRQARQLIAEYGIVIEGLKRTNSQLISHTRELFGLEKSNRFQDHNML